MRCVVALPLLLVLLAPPSARPAKLPSYIKACKRNDPKLNECVVKNGREAIPVLVNGDTKLGIPKLDPLEIDKVVVGDSKSGKGLGITFTCNKCKISGLRNSHLEDGSSIDLKKRHIELKLTIPKLKVAGKYTAEGRVLILPIRGAGDAIVQMSNLKLIYNLNYEVRKAKDGKDHVQVNKTPKLSFSAEQFNINLTNLFNGDKALGDQMNIFLNENWREVMKEFSPAIAETINKIVLLIVDTITQKVPYDDIFLK